MIFKQAFRVAFMALIWKQYKSTILSTLALLAFLLIISNIHSDYLIATGADNIDPLSFVYKWLAYAAGIVIYLLFHLIRSKAEPSEASTQEKITESKQLENTDQDPFSEIRSRKKLRSRADFLIDEAKED